MPPLVTYTEVARLVVGGPAEGDDVLFSRNAQSNAAQIEVRCTTYGDVGKSLSAVGTSILSQ